MSYRATVIEVMIASPSDVDDERQAVRDVLTNWNRLHSSRRSVVLLPLGWDTHSAADLSGRPQALINDRILRRSDLLVGIFGVRVGSPTGKAVSGTIEEVQEHHRTGKPVMLYFSKADIPRDHDRGQLRKLEEFKKWARPLGIYREFTTATDLWETFRNELEINLHGNPYLHSLMAAAEEQTVQREVPPAPTLSDDAMRLLLLASKDEHGMILVGDQVAGSYVQAGREPLFEIGSQREFARWHQAVHDLLSGGFIRDKNGKGQFFDLTSAGYDAVESAER